MLDVLDDEVVVLLQDSHLSIVDQFALSCNVVIFNSDDVINFKTRKKEKDRMRCENRQKRKNPKISNLDVDGVVSGNNI